MQLLTIQRVRLWCRMHTFTVNYCRMHTFTVNYVHPSEPFCSARSQLLSSLRIFSATFSLLILFMIYLFSQKHGRILIYSPHDVIVSQGQMPRGIFIILFGLVRVSYFIYGMFRYSRTGQCHTINPCLLFNIPF